MEYLFAVLAVLIVLQFAVGILKWLLRATTVAVALAIGFVLLSERADEHGLNIPPPDRIGVDGTAGKDAPAPDERIGRAAASAFDTALWAAGEAARAARGMLPR